MFKTNSKHTLKQVCLKNIYVTFWCLYICNSLNYLFQQLQVSKALNPTKTKRIHMSTVIIFLRLCPPNSIILNIPIILSPLPSLCRVISSDSKFYGFLYTYTEFCISLQILVSKLNIPFVNSPGWGRERGYFH